MTTPADLAAARWDLILGRNLELNEECAAGRALRQAVYTYAEADAAVIIALSSLTAGLSRITAQYQRGPEVRSPEARLLAVQWNDLAVGLTTTRMTWQAIQVLFASLGAHGPEDAIR